MSPWIIWPFFAVALVLALLIGLRPAMTRSREGRILAFAALFLLPVCAILGGFSEHMQRATSTQFCLSCHVMEGFGKSLLLDDAGYLPAAHYQNGRIPRDHACYTCHTEYAMFGGLNAKIGGMHHIIVQYLGTLPKPEEIKLYKPFNNRECLHCHLGAREFEESQRHQKVPNQMQLMKSGEMSCLSSGCHEIVHDIASLKDNVFWKELPSALSGKGVTK